MDDLAGEFADDNPHDVPQDDGDARADAEGEGIKEKVILKKMTRTGMLPKKSSLASLKAPVNAAEYGLKKILADVEAGHLSSAFATASIMRVHAKASVIGLATAMFPEEMLDSDKAHIEGDDGYILVSLSVNPNALKQSFVFDSSASPIEFIHNLYKVAPTVNRGLEHGGV